MKFTVLIADDEKNIREGLAKALELDGYRCVTAQDGLEAKRIVDSGGCDLVISDLRMPGMTGDALLRHVTEAWPGIQVIILTGHGSIDAAVESMRLGAYDFLTKPVNLDRLSLLVKRALSARELQLKTKALQEELESKRQFMSVIGRSPQMKSVTELVRRVAPTKANVLISGESGVGKELIADAIHNLSPRRDKPLIKVHCAALAESLLESELFGHEKGAFTGAQARKRGRFELAHEGSLFLDEIGEINQNVQIKILRVLQERKFERVGGEETVEVDVRIIAATNKNLKEEIEKGSFREDLYYRLNVVNIHIPPLRERRDDIALLAHAFMHEFAQENGKNIEGIDSQARACLFSYRWPGNVRELRNCMESAVVMARGSIIQADDLPPSVRSAEEPGSIRIPPGTSMAEAERIIIAETLLAQGGNKSRTAELLGIGRKTLHRKIEEYGIEGKGA
jgi:DNA-binding NtrC family response regulator